MLTVDDCIHFCDANQSEIEAIAEHEHVDSAVACELAADFNSTPHGRREMIRIMVDDIVHAEEHRQFKHAFDLRHSLREYLASHHYI